MRISYLIFSALFLFSCSENAEETKNSVNESNEPTAENNTSNDEEISQSQLKGDPATTEMVETIVETKDGKKIKVLKEVSVPTQLEEIIGIEDDSPRDLQVEAPPMPQVDFSGVYGQILKSFVSGSGKVNYSGIKTSKEMLNQATMHFEENQPQSSWSKNQKLAYWINAYNLYTIKLVVDNYPVKSIKDIAGGKPWDKKFINLRGRTLSLNDIENGIIRKEFNEPRIHFAVNCASISCPKLINKEFTSGNLNSLLESQTKRFINDNSMNSITATNPQISNIFEWYGSDFGNVITFINKYSNTKIDSDAKIAYKDYNWNLNK